MKSPYTLVLLGSLASALIAAPISARLYAMSEQCNPTPPAFKALQDTYRDIGDNRVVVIVLGKDNRVAYKAVVTRDGLITDM